MTTVRLDPVYIGQTEGLAIYRVDLGASGLSAINSITNHDDNVLSGGTGMYSGLDLDFVNLWNVATDNPADVTSLPIDAALNLSSSGVVFEAGFQTLPESPNLQGTSAGNVYDPNWARLDAAGLGSLSTGEGGQVTFLLNGALATAGRYFYFADSGGNDEGAYILVSDLAAPEPTRFTLVGTSRKDIIKLGSGANAHLKYVDTDIFGKGGNDQITGARGNDMIWGQSGRDTLSGGAGDDWVAGGVGNDVLRGGGGRDAFVFDTKPSSRSNADRITDFNRKYDTFYMDNAVYKKLGKGTPELPVKLKKGAFWKGDEAHDSNDRIIYDKSSGALYYDRDGTGPAAQVQFAKVKEGVTLSYHDFMVI